MAHVLECYIIIFTHVQINAANSVAVCMPYTYYHTCNCEYYFNLYIYGLELLSIGIYYDAHM